MSSTVIAKNVQIGADGTASNNFTIFQPATPDGTLRIGNGNTGITSSAVALTSAGNLGIGTSSPQLKLVASNGGVEEIALSPTGGVNSGTYIQSYNRNTSSYLHNTNFASSHTWYSGGTRAVDIDSSGNLLVGTTAAYGKVSVVANANSNNDVWIRNDSAGSSSACGVVLNASGNSWRMGMGSTANNSNALTWVVDVSGANSEKMRLDTSGNLLVGTTSGLGNGRQVLGYLGNSGFVGLVTNNTEGTGGSAAISFRSNGTQYGSVTTSSAGTAYNTSSDYRLKHDIAPMTGALAKVAALKPVTYKWNVDDSESQGFIAHELAEVCPQAVTGEKDAVDADGNPVYQGIDTSFLVATLTAAIQELKAINDAQAETITALTARVTALEEQP